MKCAVLAGLFAFTTVAYAEDDLLNRALSCSLDKSEVKSLPSGLAAARPELLKATKEYSLPSMNLYTLNEAASAHGHQSKEIVVMPGRIMLAVDGAALDEVIKAQGLTSEDSYSPASKVAGEDKAVIAYQARQKGLESKVLIGCEYRMPEAAWPIGGSADNLEAIMKLGQ